MVSFPALRQNKKPYLLYEVVAAYIIPRRLANINLTIPFYTRSHGVVNGFL